MKEIFNQIKNSRWTLTIIQLLVLLAVLECIVFPALTMANSFINIIGFVSLLIVIAAIVMSIGTTIVEIKEKQKEEDEK